MKKVLLVTHTDKKGIIGGAEKSFENLAKALKRVEGYEVDDYKGYTGNLISKILGRLGIDYYLLIPFIIFKIKKFKPHIIITQTRISFAAIICALLTKVPIINIVRDTSDFCPKYVDIVKYEESCSGLESRSICYNCIKNWRSLRVLIGNKSVGWEYSLKASLSIIYYKIRYLFCKINLKIINYANLNIVASNLMKKILSNNLDPKKIKILTITPIKISAFNFSKSTKKNQILFIIPSYEPSHKGLDFILKLSKLIPNHYKIIIVGGIIPKEKLKNVKTNVINYERLNSNDLKKLYQSALITLVPSFSTEAFGRIVVESILNGTPVIASQNCGANEFFTNKPYLKELPINISVWVKEIKNVLNNPIKIPVHEINQIYHQFSVDRSMKQFSQLINLLSK